MEPGPSQGLLPPWPVPLAALGAPVCACWVEALGRSSSSIDCGTEAWPGRGSSCGPLPISTIAYSVTPTHLWKQSVGLVRTSPAHPGGRHPGHTRGVLQLCLGARWETTCPPGTLGVLPGQCGGLDQGFRPRKWKLPVGVGFQADQPNGKGQSLGISFEVFSLENKVVL